MNVPVNTELGWLCVPLMLPMCYTSVFMGISLPDETGALVLRTHDVWVMVIYGS